MIPAARYVAGLFRLAGRVSSKLSIAAVLGFALLLGLPWLAAEPSRPRSPTAPPVKVVRTVLAPAPAAEAPAAAGEPRRPVPAGILQVVAQRARARQQRAQRKGESGALGKAPAPAAAAAKTAAAAAPDVKVDTKAGTKADAKADAKADIPSPSTSGKADPPVPDVWSDAEIIAALRDCLRRLAPLGAEIEVADPLKQERCGAPAPVVLKRLSSSAGKVELQPPATLNCAMVAGLHAWVESTLQPAARELLGSPVVRIRSMSGYVCRNRVGTRHPGARLSEHGLANAIDIGGFVTADGRSVDVLAEWGPTVRDLRVQQERAREVAEAAKATARQAQSDATEAARAAAKAERGAKRDQALADAARKKEEAARRQQEAQQKESEWRKSLASTVGMQKLGRGADRRPIPVPSSGGKDDNEDARRSSQAAFLRRLHKGACGTFGTVLGPEANEAHRNHFHLDLIARKRRAVCE